jgi:hypothetical protein
VPHLLRHGTPVLKVIAERPMILNAVLLAKEQSLPILNVLGLTRLARAGLELTTYRLLSESTTTGLRQPIMRNDSIMFIVLTTKVKTTGSILQIFKHVHFIFATATH